MVTSCPTFMQARLSMRNLASWHVETFIPCHWTWRRNRKCLGVWLCVTCYESPWTSKFYTWTRIRRLTQNIYFPIGCHENYLKIQLKNHKWVSAQDITAFSFKMGNDTSLNNWWANWHFHILNDFWGLIWTRAAQLVACLFPYSLTTWENGTGLMFTSKHTTI